MFSSPLVKAVITSRLPEGYYATFPASGTAAVIYSRSGPPLTCYLILRISGRFSVVWSSDTSYDKSVANLSEGVDEIVRICNEHARGGL